MKWWLALLVGLLSPAAVQAAAINLSPASHDVVLEDANSSETLSFRLTNNTPASVALALSAVDFGPLGETGGIAFLGQDDQSWQHRLTPWLSLDRDLVTIDSGQSTEVKVRIDNRLDLSPGGHYAAVLAELKDSVGLADQPRSAIGWQGIMASQFYVLKKGGESYDLKFVDGEPAGLIMRWPAKIALRWRADGNTHVQPYGTVVVKKNRGRQVASGILNQDSAIILPGAVRVLETSLESGRIIWPGRYQIQVNYHHQASQEMTTVEFTWWYVPWWLPIVIIIAGLWLWRRRG